MYHHFADESLDAMLPGMLGRLLDVGGTVGSRLGEQTRELLHVHLDIAKPWRKENLTLGRKASLPAQIAETMWVLAGRNDIAFLSHYLPRAADFSDDGKVWRGGYGPRLRDWGYLDKVDQLDFVIKLLREQPDTRRAIAQIYDPAVDAAPGKDVPCNDWLHFIQRDGKLDLHVAVRSNDILWGLSGVNAFEWGALLEIMAAMVGAEAGHLHFSTTSLHLYDRHYDRAQQLSVSGWLFSASDSPRFRLPHEAFHTADLDALVASWFAVEQDIREGRALAEQLASFPEPMLRSWLYVLDTHWNGVPLPTYLLGTRLAMALEMSPKLKRVELPQPLAERFGVPTSWVSVEEARARAGLSPQALGEQIRLRSIAVVEKPVHESMTMTGYDQLNEDDEDFNPFPAPAADDFPEYCARLHAQKSKAYGDSWRRRGELLGILANVARKLDRMGGGATPDENYADTCVDLLVYLVKYELWLANPDSSDDPEAVAHRLEDWLAVDTLVDGDAAPSLRILNDLFDQLEQAAKLGADVALRRAIVGRMLAYAAPMAWSAWREHEAWKNANAVRVWQGYGE